MPEAACTSTQFHLQVSPAQFPAYWNAAQAIAGVQVAVGANSPFLLGKHLWAETRIALFEQATDTRREELKWDVDAGERDRLLGVVEQRCLTGTTGASWQQRPFHRLFDTTGLDRRTLVGEYREHMHQRAGAHPAGSGVLGGFRPAGAHQSGCVVSPLCG